MDHSTASPIRKVGVILLGAIDVARSTTFYRDVLGLSVQFTSEAFAFLDAGGVTIGLSRELAKSRQPIAGASEVVFAVDDVRAAHAALKERGLAFINEPRQVTANEWAANFNDPDGHALSIFGPPGA